MMIRYSDLLRLLLTVLLVRISISRIILILLAYTGLVYFSEISVQIGTSIGCSDSKPFVPDE